LVKVEDLTPNVYLQQEQTLFRVVNKTKLSGSKSKLEVGVNKFGDVVEIYIWEITLYPPEMSPLKKPFTEEQLEIIDDLFYIAISDKISKTAFMNKVKDAEKIVDTQKATGFLLQIWIATHPERS
jgi:hypothetical protein